MKMIDIDLGYAEQCGSEWLTNVYFPSKLGGKPAWLHLGQLPSRADLECGNCNNPKSLLCQIYAPFEDDYNFHRTIYTFVCRTESCYSANKNVNITILRSQLPMQNDYYSDVPPSDEGDAVPEVLPKNSKLCLACGCRAPLKCGRCKRASYCGVQHQRLHWPYHKLWCSTDESITCPSKHELIPQILFPEWEIDIRSIDDEIKTDLKSDAKEQNLKSDVKEDEELLKFEQLAASGKAGTFQDLHESELEKYTEGCEEVKDKYFLKFRKECKKEPFQIIRYKRNGNVLWISDIENSVTEQLENIPKCELCGEDRVFEFQIMPQMLNYLKDANVDWGVIAVYTCPRSCRLPKGIGYVKEFCIKQDIARH